MAEEATIQGVVTELQVINQLIHDTTDLHLEGLIAIESVATAIDTKVGRMLEQPAIQDTLKQFSDDIVSGITGSFDAALAYQKQRDKEQDRKEKGETGDSKGFGAGVKDSFKRGLKSETDPKKEIGKAFSGVTSFINETVETIGTIGAWALWFKSKLPSPKLILSTLGMLGNTLLAGLSGLITAITSPFALIAAAIAAVTLGIMGFVEDFQAQEGSLVDKIIAGMYGFIDGFLKILTIPLDWLIDLTAKILEVFGFDGAAKVLEEFSLTDLVDSITDGILEWVLKIKDGLVGFAKNAWDGIKGFFGFDDDEEEPKMLSDSERKVLEDVKEAREDGVQRMVEQGYTEKEAREQAEKGSFDPIKTRKQSRKLSTKQINDRLNEDMGLRVAEEAKTSEGASSEKKKEYRYDVTNPVTGELIDSADTPEEAARIAMQTGGKMENPVERTSTDKETQQRLASSVDQSLFAPRGTEALKSDRRVQQGTINGTEVLAGKPRVETEGRINGTQVLSGDTTTSVVNSTTNSSTVQEIAAPKRTVQKGTVATAMSRKPVKAAPKKSAGEKPNKYVTIDPVTGKYRAFAPNLAATGGAAYALFDTVKEANEYTQSVDPEHEKMMAAELAAFDAEFGLSAPESDTAGRISGAQGAAAQSGELQARQSDLSDAQAANTAAESNVAVVDNSQQQSIVNNSTTSGVNPSPFDKSDRTHKRGAYRGT